MRLSFFGLLLLSSLAITISSCASELTEADTEALDPQFFNLDDFVAAQATALGQTPLTKEVEVNGVVEQQQLSEVDWMQELAPFAQSNIDRPALWDMYHRDTLTETSANQYVVRYQARDSSLFTRSIEVSYRRVDEQLMPQSIVVQNRFISYVADTEQTLTWRPGKYSVVSTQKARLLDARYLRIEGEWTE